MSNRTGIAAVALALLMIGADAHAQRVRHDQANKTNRTAYRNSHRDNQGTGYEDHSFRASYVDAKARC